MPAPLVHLMYAQHYLRRRPELAVRSYFRGAAFPDIRVAAGLPRERTHRKDVTLAEIRAETDPWRAGWLLHSAVDVAWTERVSRFGLWPDDPADHYRWLALKVAEAALWFEALERRDEVASYFEGPAEPAERALVELSIVGQWDRFMAWNIRHPYETKDWQGAVRLIGFDLEASGVLLPMIADFQADVVWTQRFRALRAELEDWLDG